MMKLSKEKNQHIQELLGKLSAQLDETRKAAHPLVDDEILETLSANSKVIASLDRIYFSNRYSQLCSTFSELQSEMSEEEPQ